VIRLTLRYSSSEHLYTSSRWRSFRRRGLIGVSIPSCSGVRAAGIVHRPSVTVKRGSVTVTVAVTVTGCSSLAFSIPHGRSPGRARRSASPAAQPDPTRPPLAARRLRVNLWPLGAERHWPLGGAWFSGSPPTDSAEDPKFSASGVPGRMKTASLLRIRPSQGVMEIILPRAAYRAHDAGRHQRTVDVSPRAAAGHGHGHGHGHAPRSRSRSTVTLTVSRATSHVDVCGSRAPIAFACPIRAAVSRCCG